MKYDFIDRLNLAAYLAVRRLLPKSSTPGASLLPKLAFTSVTLGVTASILILSLANGLHYNYLERLAEKDAHITVLAPNGIPEPETFISLIKSINGVVDSFPYAQGEVLLKSWFETQGALLKALPARFTNDATFLRLFSLQQGEWSFGKPRTITIGESVAQSLGLFLNDHIDVMIYDQDLGAITYRFKVAGIFSAGDASLDSSLVFISYKDAREILGFGAYAPYIGIRVRDFLRPEKYLAALEKEIPFQLTTWRMSNLNSILALNNEKQIIRMLLFIFFCVAFFGILSTMTALVADKREEIALLKALGMTPTEDALSFGLTGLFLGLSASALGSFFGIILSLNFNRIVRAVEAVINGLIQTWLTLTNQPPIAPFTFLNQKVYYLKEFPILLQAGDVFFSCFLAVSCVLLASLYPAGLSQKFKPAEILRKE
ncbi:ABC-type transport system, involved in lipoprotein release, permease component [Brevinema andersonii]|uniref:ABC-type transport system, involved in lipoprotein release, permease component n=1 Tax=Brevinema andersonii TaxID=34097 RepID=A0A1I1EHQ2_BREAD|nr:ABC transporter permease [Brevinema andersonii]SFB86669.1 ABC-type transport system, involved in lipoprotein release, permease component [Brevinema andersonii]